MPGTLVAVATIVMGLLMPGAVMAMAAMIVAVRTPGPVVAVAAMMGRNEDEGVRRKTVPVTVPARIAMGILALVAFSMPPLFVRHPEKGSRGNSKENRLAGRKGMAELAAATLSLAGERRLDAERKHCDKSREQGPEQGR